MGPEATIAFYSRVVKDTPAGRDQDHLRVIIDSNPGIPDRTAAIHVLYPDIEVVAILTIGRISHQFAVW